MRALRIVELVCFGLICVQTATMTVHMTRRYGWLTAGDAAVGHPMVVPSATLLDPVSLRWFALIIGYGALIPNTWRRCAWVAGVIALVALGTVLADAVLTGVPGDQLPGVMMYPVHWVALASVIAVVGSHRLNVLERRVREATRLGQYRLCKLLGGGGMGEVYLAEHVMMKQPCAVKVIRPERAGDETTLKRFEREVQATARLAHWNTVRVYDYGHAADRTFYYAMEYLPGLSLEELVRRHGPVPAARAIHILRQVCSALREAHGLGLIHRDVKPANIIVTPLGGEHDVVKLLDFGLVREVGTLTPGDRLTVEGVVAGTPAYMSPEQASGQDSLDGRSDIYSLGAVAYYLLTGQPPFTHRDALALLKAHRSEPVAPPKELCPDVPGDVQDVVLRCLAKKRADRYADAERLRAALSACEASGEWSEAEAAAWWQAQSS
jgi:serine/threonine-protein kinase